MSRHRLSITTVRERQSLEQYFNELRSGGLADSSIARATSTLRGWFGFMVDEGHLANDPTARSQGRTPRSNLAQPLGEQEVTDLLESLPFTTATDLRDRALLELLYDTGVLRVSRLEAGGHRSLSEPGLRRGTHPGDRQGFKQRLVPMGDTLRLVLVDYLGAGGRSEIPNARRSTRLFLNARGGALSRQGVDLIIHKRALVAGIEHSRISRHVFRHSCATHMLAHGADIRVVQELLGHASIATTQIYTAVSVTSLQREYRNAHPRAHD